MFFLGCVTMWSPVIKEPLVKMLCHRGPILSVAVDRQGVYVRNCCFNNSFLSAFFFVSIFVVICRRSVYIVPVSTYLLIIYIGRLL